MHGKMHLFWNIFSPTQYDRSSFQEYYFFLIEKILMCTTKLQHKLSCLLGTNNISNVLQS